MFHVHRHGDGLVDGRILREKLGQIPYFSGLKDPLLLDLGIDLGLESPSPERRGQLVSLFGVARADLRESERASAPQTSVFTFAHTEPYLGFECDAPCAAKLPFDDGQDLDVGRCRARRARHRRLVLVLLRLVELVLYARAT